MEEKNNMCNKTPLISKKTKRNNYRFFYKLIGNKNKIERRLYKVFITAFIIIGFILVIEISLITWGTDNVNLSKLGPFGDFFGGMLNPILSFCTFMALLMTIVLQQNELHETQKATRDSAEALKEQSYSISLQNFENTFFKMLNLHIETTNSLVLLKLKKDWLYNGTSRWMGQKDTIHEKDRIYFYKILETTVEVEERDDIYGKKVISKLFEIINKYIKSSSNQIKVDELYNNFHKEYNEIVGHYFRNIYQILKYIKKTSEKNEINIDSKFYANILRAQLSNAELALLFLNALSKYGKDQLLPLLIEYEFIEPLPISTINESYLKEAVLLVPDYNIFGDNEEWKEYITSISQEPQ